MKIVPARVTNRLLLQMPQPTDLDAIYQIHGDPATNRFNPNGPMKNLEDAQATLDKWISHWDQAGFGYWSVRTVDEPARVIGFGGIMEKNMQGETRLNLYFRFAPAAWGHGYAGEMARAALGMAFGPLEYDAVWAMVRTGNTPSRKALERLGMSVHGSIDDVPPRDPSLLYCIDRETHEGKKQHQAPHSGREQGQLR